MTVLDSLLLKLLLKFISPGRFAPLRVLSSVAAPPSVASIRVDLH